MRKERSSKWYAFTALSLFLIMMVNCGIGFYSLSLFVEPIATTFGVTSGDVALLYTFYSVGSAIAALFLHRLMKHFSLKGLIIFGGVISVLGYVDFIMAGSLRAMYPGGILIGASTVFAGTATVQLGVARWFEKKRSVITGVVAAASGVGTAVGGPVIGEIIASFGWRKAFAVIGALVFVLVCIQALFLFFDKPQDKNILPYGMGGEQRQMDKSSESTGISIKTARKKPQFCFFVLGLLMTSLIYQTISLYQSSILLEKGFSAGLAATCLSAFAVVDMTSKATAGIVADKKGFRVVTTYCALAVLLAFLLVRVIHTTFGAILFSALLGFWPTILVLYGVTVSISLYGKKYLVEYIGFTQTVMCCFSMIGMPVIRILYNAVGNFEIIINLVLVFAVLFFAFMFYLLQPKHYFEAQKWQNPAEEQSAETDLNKAQQ